MQELRGQAYDNVIQHPKQPEPYQELKPLTYVQINKLTELLDTWMADESGYDEETWDNLMRAIDEERGQISARRLFR